MRLPFLAEPSAAWTDETWLSFPRAHLHAGGIGALAIAGSLVLLALLPVRPGLDTVASTFLGVGAMGYPLFWLLAGLGSPGLAAAAKESLCCWPSPSAGALVAGGVLGLGLNIGDLFPGRARRAGAGRRAVASSALAALLGAPAALSAQGAGKVPASPPSPTPGIADNSFLLEEAYNQETGVIQHISTFSRFGADDWVYTFTQEWPVPGQKHQLSVTLPVQQVSGATGVGDVALNYRYQALDGSRGGVAFSPRLSLLVPTGSSSRGLGAGGTGIQANLPVSVAFGSRIVMHSNLGATWVPTAKNAAGDEAATMGFSAGQSVIWLARPTFNVLVEMAWTRSHEVTGTGTTARSDSLYASPGIRWAHNLGGGLQIVPGLAFPIGVGPSRGDNGLLLYLSFEHPFRRAR